MRALQHLQPRTRRDWTTEEDARLLDLRCKELSMADIGKLLDRQPSSIKSRLDKLSDMGVEVPKLHGFMADRPRKKQGAAVPIKRVRPCLCCGRQFNSDGPHNRLCGSCRLKSVSPYELYA